MSENRTKIMSGPQATTAQAQAFLQKRNPNAPNYTKIYQKMGERYGIAWDLAFAQSILETGAWKFGNLVKPSQNNFSGLGATGPGNEGASFATPEEGIEAQFQHLYGYATKEPLPPGVKLVDPRFHVLEKNGLRESAPYWESLNGKWAVPGDNYGQTIVNMRKQMLEIQTGDEPDPTAEKGQEGPYPDVAADSWASEAIASVTAEGLMRGYPDGHFHPQEPIMREQFALVVSNFLKKYGK